MAIVYPAGMARLRSPRLALGPIDAGTVGNSPAVLHPNVLCPSAPHPAPPPPPRSVSHRWADPHVEVPASITDAADCWAQPLFLWV